MIVASPCAVVLATMPPLLLLHEKLARAASAESLSMPNPPTRSSGTGSGDTPCAQLTAHQANTHRTGCRVPDQCDRLLRRVVETVPVQSQVRLRAVPGESLVGVLQTRQPHQRLQQRRRFEERGPVDIALQGPGIDPGSGRVQRTQIVHLRITGKQLGRMQQECDIERLVRFVLRHAA